MTRHGADVVADDYPTSPDVPIRSVRTQQCLNCCFVNSRRCVYHGYPDNNILLFCMYKIGTSAFEAQENWQGTQLEWKQLKEHDNKIRMQHCKIPSSKELIQLAIADFKNREERKGLHDQPSWTSGWITGFLSERKPEWGKERLKSECYTTDNQDMFRVGTYINDCEYMKRWRTTYQSQTSTNPDGQIVYNSYFCALFFCKYPGRKCEVKK